MGVQREMTVAQKRASEDAKPPGPLRANYRLLSLGAGAEVPFAPLLGSNKP